MKKLVKTVVGALIGMAIGYAMGGDTPMIGVVTMAGFASGWRVVRKSGIIPLNFMSIFIYILIAAIIGFVALPIELISGLLALRKERM